jgi:hypothetical protein
MRVNACLVQALHIDMIGRLVFIPKRFFERSSFSLFLANDDGWIQCSGSGRSLIA